MNDIMQPNALEACSSNADDVVRVEEMRTMSRPQVLEHLLTSLGSAPCWQCCAAPRPRGWGGSKGGREGRWVLEGNTHPHAVKATCIGAFLETTGLVTLLPLLVLLHGGGGGGVAGGSVGGGNG